MVEHKTGSKYLVINGRALYTTSRKIPSLKILKDPVSKSLIANVRKTVNKYILENNFNIEPVKLVYPACSIDRGKYKSLDEGAEFFYVDIKHAYWRIAYKMGVICKPIYERYKDSQKFKLVRNIALSTLARSITRDYYRNGKLLNSITCVSDHYKQIYKNIRYTTYNLTGTLNEIAGKNSIGYKIDGLLVLPAAVNKIKQQIKNKRFFYSVTKCKKIDDKRFLFGTEEKIFR